MHPSFYIFLGILTALGAILLLVWWVIDLDRKKDASLRRSPFTTELARLPGQSASDKASELREQWSSFVDALILGIGLIFGSLLGYSLAPVHHFSLPALAIGSLVGLSAIALAIFRLRQPLREARQWQLGADGERHTAQAIQPLAAYGCEFFHDLPFKDPSGRAFNIDHVVLAPWGVLVIETKARRKAKDQKGPDSAKVKFDGAALRFPGYYDTAALDQVRANTRFLAKKLHDRTGEKVLCLSVIALPGWYVETLTPNSEVIVCNPLQLWKHLAHRTDQTLGPAQHRRMVAYLGELAKLPTPPV